MITINVKKTNDKVEQIIIKGHAGYDVYGKDIVCASVSSIVITSVNAILKLNSKAITYHNDDVLEILVNAQDSVTDILLNNMIDLLIELSETYKKNIKINI
ncbi:MAG: ribosomal-processing cysteine protease Prp [Bacilli bacterium]